MARVRWDRVGRIGLLVVLAVVGGLYVTHILSFLQTKAQDDSQLATVRTLIRSNDKLERQQQALSQPATIAADARRLGMVKVGEHPYVIARGN